MIIKETRLHLLVQKVNEKLEKGYKLYGQPFREDGMLCQEVIKKQSPFRPESEKPVLPKVWPESKLSKPYDMDAYTPRGEVFVKN